MQTIEIHNGTMLLVEVKPVDKRIRISFNGNHLLHSNGAIDLPSGSWHLVCIYPDNHQWVDVEDWFDSDAASFKGWLVSKGVDVSKRWAVLKNDKK